MSLAKNKKIMIQSPYSKQRKPIKAEALITKRRQLTPLFIKDLQKAFQAETQIITDVFEEALSIQKA